MSKKAVLAIGVSHFDNTKYQELRLAVKDAKDIFETLTGKEYGVYDKRISNLVPNPSYQEAINEINLFFSNISSNDSVLIYIASHGLVVSGRKYFIALRDTEIENRLISNSALDVDTLINYLIEKRISNYVIIIDCCRSGKVLQSPNVRSRSSNFEFSSLYENHTGAGKIIIATAQHYELAYELDNIENGLFIHLLKKCVEAGINNGNKYLSIKELYDLVYTAIIADYSHISQRPEYSGNEVNGRIIVSKNSQYQIHSNSNFEGAFIPDESLLSNHISDPVVSIARDYTSDIEDFSKESIVERIFSPQKTFYYYFRILFLRSPYYWGSTFAWIFIFIGVMIYTFIIDLSIPFTLIAIVITLGISQFYFHLFSSKLLGRKNIDYYKSITYVISTLEKDLKKVKANMGLIQNDISNFESGILIFEENKKISNTENHVRQIQNERVKSKKEFLDLVSNCYSKVETLISYFVRADSVLKIHIDDETKISLFESYYRALKICIDAVPIVKSLNSEIVDYIKSPESLTWRNELNIMQMTNIINDLIEEEK